MNKVGIICGDGNLPLYIGNSLSKKKFDVTFLLLNSIKNKKPYKNKNIFLLSALSASQIIKILKKNNIKYIIFAGSLKRPSLMDLGYDFETIKLAKDLLLEKKGDNNLLIALKKYFEKKGFSFLNWTKYCNDLFSNEDNLTIFKPSKISLENLSKAKSIYRNFKNIDVGQSIIIQNKIVLGIEAIEGTDQLIKRCSKYKRKGDGGILLKFTKEKQSNLIDIPLIGLQTIKNLKKYNYDGIFLEKNKCLIINKKKVIKYANVNKIFITSVKLN